MSCTNEAQIQFGPCIFLKGLCWVSVGYWIMHGVPSLGCFLVILCPIHCAINIWHYMLCYLPNIDNYITFIVSLERVQFEFVKSFSASMDFSFYDQTYIFDIFARWLAHQSSMDFLFIIRRTLWHIRNQKWPINHCAVNFWICPMSHQSLRSFQWMQFKWNFLCTLWIRG